MNGVRGFWEFVFVAFVRRVGLSWFRRGKVSEGWIKEVFFL